MAGLAAVAAAAVGRQGRKRQRRAAELSDHNARLAAMLQQREGPAVVWTAAEEEDLVRECAAFFELVDRAEAALIGASKWMADVRRGGRVRDETKTHAPIAPMNQLPCCN